MTGESWRRLGARAGELPPQRLFLALGLVAGLLTVILTPPFEGADEPAHLRRAFQLSDGRIIAQKTDDGVGGMLPPSLRLRRPAAGPRVFVDFRNTAVYAPAPYLPHALALLVGRAAALGPAGQLYVARLAGLAASLWLVVAAIRVTPVAKHVFVLLALMPMSIRQMSLVTADSVTNGFSFLLLALCLRLALTPASSSPSASVVPLALCCLVVSLSKLAYLPLVFLYFLIPPARLGGARRYAIGFLIVGGLSILAGALWLWLIRDLYVAQKIAPTADPAAQTAFILAHPLRYGRILLADLYHNGATYLRHCLGYAGPMPHLLAWPHLAIVALVALLDGRKDAALDLRAKGLVLAVFACTYVSINTLNYLGWNPVASTRIRFVQGRYYLPIAPLPFLLLSNRRLASLLPEGRLGKLSGAIAALFSVVVIRNLLRWYGI
jgi:uncharacterized membrane protein